MEVHRHSILLGRGGSLDDDIRTSAGFTAGGIFGSMGTTARRRGRIRPDWSGRLLQWTDASATGNSKDIRANDDRFSGAATRNEPASNIKFGRLFAHAQPNLSGALAGCSVGGNADEFCGQLDPFWSGLRGTSAVDTIRGT